MDTRRDLNGSSDGVYANDVEPPLREIFAEWRPQLVRADRQLRLFIRRNPVAALATMALAGFVLGRWLRK